MSKKSSKILIIDDSKPIHSLVKARLAGDSYEFFSAEDGVSGIELAKQILPDLILLDVDMPEMKGVEVCQKLKEVGKLFNVPVIFLTGSSTVEEKVNGLKAGAVDYVTKPFDAAELSARVGAAMRTKNLLDLLATKAQIDGLTGLHNRSYFDQRLAQELAGQESISCVIADIDHFKSVNDRFGHPFGDQVLRDFALLLNDQAGSDAVVCRYGGEEFVILYPGLAEEDAYLRAEKIRNALPNLDLKFKGQEVKVTASFGVAQGNSKDLVDQADAALYFSKHNGRNRVTRASALPTDKAIAA